MLRCMGCMAEMEHGIEVCPLCGYVRGTTAREAYHLAPETVLQGRYLVGRVLGYGGFGVTYIGYDAGLERLVAIKEFLPSTFATRIPGDTAVTVYEGNASAQFTAGLSRFVEEAQTLAQFNGIPGIVDIYDSFEANSTAYIVMQLLKGHDVKAILSASGSLPYETAREIILQVCDTLTPVHARGIIHRDISPDNIYITQDNEIKLLDFGAARYESAVNSKSLSVILKSGYAPEEQYRSRGDQGTWTDVYALAATFYKMITGVTPPDSMERAIKDEIKEPSKLGVELPQSAENALLNALCVRKADRTKTAAEFKAALLADGVERVKVKQTRAGTGRVPMAARIAIGVSLCLLLCLGIFAASGGFDEAAIVLGGTKLEDTYGTVDKEGFSAVPQLAGKTQQEAEALLAELGLTAQIESYYFDTAVVKQPMVSDQTPTAGQQLEEGSTVSITMNVGEYLDAREKGWAPDIRGMTLSQLSLFKEKNRFRNGGLIPKFVYSEESDLGRVVDVVPDFDNGTSYMRYEAVVGAGPNDAAPPLGELRLLTFEGGDIGAVVASGTGLREEDGNGFYNERERYITYHALRVSADGGTTWEEIPLLRQNRFEGYPTHGEDKTPRPSWEFMQVVEPIAVNRPDLCNKDLRLRVSRHYESSGEEIDALEAENTLYIEMGTDGPRIDSVERVPESEFQALYDAGRFGNDTYSIENFLQDSESSDLTIFRVKGNFSLDEWFQCLAKNQFGTGRDGHVMCTKEGELLVQTWEDDEANRTRSITLYDSGHSPVQDEAGRYTCTITPSVTYTFPG